MRIPTLVAATASVLLTAMDLAAQSTASPPAFSYADLTDRTIAASVIPIATVTRAIALKSGQSPGLAPGHVRLFVEATATTLIRGPALTPKLTYLADVRLDARGRPPKLKGAKVVLLARPVPGRPGVLQLVSPDAQLPLTPETERTIRGIVTEVVAPSAPPAITGVASAFHVPGAIPGEGETQIFLSTRSGDPISISVLRRPGETPRWSVALGEVVDEASTTPAPNTLLWYRLACGLPATLPAEAVAELDAVAAESARTDYALVIERLGPCGRTIRR